MNDLISRQAAIDALARTAREKFNLSDEYHQYLAGLMDAELEIKYLPSAERRGRWIYNANFAEPLFKCSACGKSQGRLSKYCPNCGARMEAKE